MSLPPVAVYQQDFNDLSDGWYGNPMPVTWADGGAGWLQHSVDTSETPEGTPVLYRDFQGLRLGHTYRFAVVADPTYGVESTLTLSVDTGASSQTTLPVGGPPNYEPVWTEAQVEFMATASTHRITMEWGPLTPYGEAAEGWVSFDNFTLLLLDPTPTPEQRPPIAPVNMRNATLEIQADDFTAQINQVLWLPQFDYRPVFNAAGHMVSEAMGQRRWSLALGFVQDLTSPTALTTYLIEHAAQQKIVTFTAGDRVVIATVLIMPGQFGGVVNQIPTATVTLPVYGQPDFGLPDEEF